MDVALASAAEARDGAVTAATGAASEMADAMVTDAQAVLTEMGKCGERWSSVAGVKQSTMMRRLRQQRAGAGNGGALVENGAE